MAVPSRTFFRVVKTNPPKLEDFLSNDEKGMMPPDPRPETLLIWAGVSVYATMAQARQMARRYTGHGDFLASIAVQEGSTIRVERTLGRPGHHTIWGSSDALLAAVVAVEPL